MNTQEELLHYFARRTYHLAGFERRLERVYSRLAVLRLVLFFGGLVIAAFLALQQPWQGGVAVLVIGSAFVFVALRHQRCARSLKRSQLLREHDREQVARIELDWDVLASPAQARASAEHPFDNDLDISGERSLLHLIDTSVSDGGSARLARWLQSATVNVEQSRKRQSLVSELQPLKELREGIALDTKQISSQRLEGDDVIAWLQREEPSPIPSAVLWFGRLLSAATIASAIAALFGFMPSLWLTLAVVQIVLALLMQGRVKQSFGSGTLLHDRLRALRGLFQRLETFDYSATPGLADICTPFRKNPAPSSLIDRLNNILTAISVRENMVVFAILNGLFPWDITAAARMTQVRNLIRADLGDWLERVYQLEALMSLANFAWLHPDESSYPELLDENSEPLIEATSVGHVLIDRTQRVRNDFSLNGRGTIMLLTGSNMSGKSTFMRTIGISIALAFAGGPVLARSLRVSPIRMFTCIRMGDSVLDGISSFYAEVKRLKSLLAELEGEHPQPLLYFIDEIFRGTNNRERLIGSRATIAALVNKNGFGLVTTHDLELTALADMSQKIHNFHFREHIADGRMHFDYTLRPGPCPTTNALEIMRQEGLPVEVPV